MIKLDLMNDRFPFNPKPSTRTHDSMEEFDFSKTEFVAAVKKNRRGKFSNTRRIFSNELGWIPTCDHSERNYKGEYVEVSKRITAIPMVPIKEERKQNYFDLKLSLIHI